MPASSQNLERYLWPLFWAALLTYFIQSLLHDTPLYPYRLVALTVAIAAFAALTVAAIVRHVRRRE
jgi:hypothetical protein